MSTRNAWFTPLLSNVLRGTLDRYAMSCERARLRTMSESELSDMGLSRRDAMGESMRPFWQGTRCS